MENPFLQTMKSRTSWRFFGAFMALSVIATYSVTSKYKDSINESTIKRNAELIKTQSQHDSEAQRLKSLLKEKEDKLKVYEVQHKVISEHIRSQNKNLSPQKVELYTKTIIQESVKRGQSPNYQASILDSEADFESNPKHALSYVVGMGGTNWKQWGSYLKEKGIARCKEDLKNPIVAIKATAEIYAYYMKVYKNNPREAITGYKGYCALGRKQANQVVSIALQLRAKEDKELRNV